jgi:hypothetical protein
VSAAAAADYILLLLLLLLLLWLQAVHSTHATHHQCRGAPVGDQPQLQERALIQRQQAIPESRITSLQAAHICSSTKEPH